ncbi:MAG: FAD-dependent oxidoreductase, partial [Actinomycetota bacterium]
MSTRMKMIVEGMIGDSCDRHVADALRFAGATDVEVDRLRGEATFSAPADAGIEPLKEAVDASGYTSRDVKALGPQPTHHRQAADDGYNLVVLGSGSAAFAAAIRARDLGARVAVVERATIGGTCVNIGCVPSKALLRAGELHFAAGHHPFAGITTSSGTVDLSALVAQKDELVARLRKEKYENLVHEYGFDFLRGQAHFVDAETLVVDGRRIQAEAYVVATGASPAVPSIPGLEEAGYLTSTTALDADTVPGSLAVIGANAVGLELGQFFGHVGAKVTFF